MDIYINLLLENNFLFLKKAVFNPTVPWPSLPGKSYLCN